MIERRQCPVCGGEIVFSLITPERNFYINDNGHFDEDDNNLYMFYNGTYKPFLEFYCMNDREHNLDSDKGFEKWSNEVSKIFFKGTF